MQNKCVDCKKKYEFNPDLIKLRPITQVFCERCYQKLLGGTSIKERINKIPASVLGYDHDGVVKIANEQAKAQLGRNSDQLLNKVGGEIIDCVYAKQRNGCGKAPNCEECTAREYLYKTLTTGEAFSDITANQIRKTTTGLIQFDFKFSMEKLRDLVLFRLDKQI